MGKLLIVASFAFVVAMSGALVPGPLLTYTILKTLQTPKRSAYVGAWIILGHAVLESAIIMLLLLGFARILNHPITVKIIGGVGGIVLVFLGLSLMYDLLRSRVPNLFAREVQKVSGQGVDIGKVDIEKKDRLPRPILGGILVSMSNPYWWVWWATIGLAFILKYEISFRSWPLLVAFFLGHEAGDLAVYWLVSALIAIGKNRMSDTIYKIILAGCALVMVGFGLYLGISPFV